MVQYCSKSDGARQAPSLYWGPCITLSPCKLQVIPMETFFIAASGFCRISLVIYLYCWWIWIYASKGGEGHMNMNKRCMILDYKGRSQKNAPSNFVSASVRVKNSSTRWNLHSWRGIWMNTRVVLRNISHITLFIWILWSCDQIVLNFVSSFGMWKSKISCCFYF